jgi:hypothetical protein
MARAHRFVVANVSAQIQAAQIQANMRDVAFWFRKESSFPKLQDSGLADVLLGGEGLAITAHLTSAKKDKSSVLKVKNVNVKKDTLKFSIRDSKQDLLYKTLRPLATGLVKTCAQLTPHLVPSLSVSRVRLHIYHVRGESEVLLLY